MLMGQGQQSLVTGSEAVRRVISHHRASKQTSAERTTAAAHPVNQQIVPQQISDQRFFRREGEGVIFHVLEIQGFNKYTGCSILC